MTWDADVRSVRQAIYTSMVESGVVPTPADVALACAISDARVETMFRALADAHVIVLQPGSTKLWAAPPFSAVPSGFTVRARVISAAEADTRPRDRSWFAPCAWDAFGIPAALHADANIDASCSDSGDPIQCGVRDGRAFGEGVIHLLVPAPHFWDDIIYT